jgi:hypothetical protein
MQSPIECNRLERAALLICSIAVLAAPSTAQWEGDGPGPGPDDIPEGYMLYQGDILLPVDFWEQEGTFAPNIWPDDGADNTVRIWYEFDANVTAANQLLMRAAMDELEAIGNVLFQTNFLAYPYYLHIQSSAFNSSAVGRQGGEQVVNIFNWNVRHIMIHELMHAMGFWHEQSRADRDTYVQINWANISQTACGGPCDSNFQIEPGSSHWGPYDFDSVMHYGRGAFSSNGLDTITVLPPNGAWQGLIGQRNHLSEFDQLTVSFIHREHDWNFVRTAPLVGSGFATGTFYNSYVSLAGAYLFVPDGGKVIFLDAASYSAVGVYTKAVTLEATLGPVTLGS